MGRDETLARLVKLLKCLPEVQMAWAQNEPDYTSIALMVNSQDSLALLLAECAFTNTPLLKVKLSGLRPVPQEIRYILEVPEPPEGAPTPTELQFVGIFLARDLKARKLINPDESDEMQRAWNAC